MLKRGTDPRDVTDGMRRASLQHPAAPPLALVPSPVSPFDYDAMPCAVFQADAGVVTNVNVRACALLGHPRRELIGRAIESLLLVHDDAQAGTVSGELLLDQGPPIDVLTSCTADLDDPSRTLWVAMDARDHSERLKRAHQAAHFEVVGRLAAGVAHEINSPSQYISDAGHFARDAVTELLRLLQCHQELATVVRQGGDPGEVLAQLDAAAARADDGFVRRELPPAIDSIIEGAGRIAEIIRTMKELTHGVDRPDAPADVNGLIESAVRMTRAACRHVAKVETQLERLPPLVCSASELGKVLVNLIVNARDAIAEVGADDGLIRIQSRLREAAIEIEVSDNGVGIPAPVQSRVFEPFFTTKAVGIGTGQGLAMVRTAIEDRHGGRVILCSEPGAGTTVRLTLPLQRSGVSP